MSPICLCNCSVAYGYAGGSFRIPPFRHDCAVRQVRQHAVWADGAARHASLLRDALEHEPRRTRAGSTRRNLGTPDPASPPHCQSSGGIPWRRVPRKVEHPVELAALAGTALSMGTYDKTGNFRALYCATATRSGAPLATIAHALRIGLAPCALAAGEAELETEISPNARDVDVGPLWHELRKAAPRSPLHPCIDRP